MQLVETRLCPMGNRKFVPHPVGADAHIGPYRLSLIHI